MRFFGIAFFFWTYLVLFCEDVYSMDSLPSTGSVNGYSLVTSLSKATESSSESLPSTSSVNGLLFGKYLINDRHLV